MRGARAKVRSQSVIIEWLLALIASIAITLAVLHYLGYLTFRVAGTDKVSLVVEQAQVILYYEGSSDYSYDVNVWVENTGTVPVTVSQISLNYQPSGTSTPYQASASLNQAVAPGQMLEISTSITVSTSHSPPGSGQQVYVEVQYSPNSGQSSGQTYTVGAYTTVQTPPS